LKYILKFFYIFFIIILHLNYIDFFHVNSQSNQFGNEYISINKINDDNNLKINNTFSIEGSLISTIIQNLTSIYSNNSEWEKIPHNTTQSINAPTNGVNLETPLEPDLLNNSFNSSLPPMDLQQQEQGMLFISDPNSSNINNTGLNEPDSISDNLVSMLSAIIIESIHNGNPTIIDENIQNNSSMKDSRDIILVSGKWKMDVKDGNVTNFDTNFVMITSNGTGFHWHSMKNFTTEEDLFLGIDDNSVINGKLDFFTGNNSTKKTVDVLLSINNLELIQIILLDKEISNHFYGFPIYGTIDSIKREN